MKSYKHQYIYILSKNKPLKVIEVVGEQKGHYREVEQVLRQGTLSNF